MCSKIRITFFSNYLTHHQIPFCNEMYRMLLDDFTFSSTEEMEEERKEQGWELTRRYPYELKAYESREAYLASILLAKESDVILIGSAPEAYVKERMRYKTDGITLRYSERIYRMGSWRVLSPRGWIRRYETYFQYRHQKLYLLCASAYAPRDYSLLGSYLGRCYKWGYFPEVKYYDPDVLMNRKPKDRLQLLWCGRFLKLKHPEAAIRLAVLLRQQGVDFLLNMIGSGETEPELRALIQANHLKAYVKLVGAMSYDKVRYYMEESHIFLFTSDFTEGWGAVVNEAMNSGCAVVASHAAGCVPFLIESGYNGLIYQNGNITELHEKVSQLIADRKQCEEIGRNAYKTIITEWNAKEAANRFLLLIQDLQEKGKCDRFESGPCSKAKIIKNNWYGDRKH